jgi:hypothetical protein
MEDTLASGCLEQGSGVLKPLWPDPDTCLFSRPNSPAVTIREKEEEEEEEQQAAATLLELSKQPPLSPDVIMVSPGTAGSGIPERAIIILREAGLPPDGVDIRFSGTPPQLPYRTAIWVVLTHMQCPMDHRAIMGKAVEWDLLRDVTARHFNVKKAVDADSIRKSSPSIFTVDDQGRVGLRAWVSPALAMSPPVQQDCKPGPILQERDPNVPRSSRDNDLAGPQKMALTPSRSTEQASVKRKLTVEDTASCWASLPPKRARRPSHWLKSDQWDLTLDK